MIICFIIFVCIFLFITLWFIGNDGGKTFDK